MRRRLIGLVFLSLTILIILLSGTLVWQLNEGPDPKSTGSIAREVESFLLGTYDARDQHYSIVNLEGPVDDWVLVTLARIDFNLSEDTGSEGAIAIGHFNGTWEFQLQDQGGNFNTWLDQLPTELLDPDLRKYFQVQDEELNYQHQGYRPIGSLQAELTFYLPYPASKRYKVTTLPGQFYHQGSIQYAIDFDMLEGHQIAAVASGEVVGIKDDSNRGGCDKRFAGEANFIRIKTAPNESVLYLHTPVNSITESDLHVGSRVETGQVIAKSGSTGFTCNWRGSGPGAHLHIIREKWCGSRICGSLPLRFTEFGPTDPRTGIYYVSANLSVQERERIEREKQQKEQSQIQQAVDNFITYYSCAKTVGCYDLAIPEAKLVTKNVRGQLIDELTSCFGCTFFWDEHKIESLEYLTISQPDSGTAKVRTKQQWYTANHSDTYTHFSVVVITLLKEDSTWKADSWEIECGYVLKGDGEVVHSENLEGCPWQPTLIPTPTSGTGG